MKLKPKNYIQRAVKAFREQHGASDLGSYRDVVTDILHMAFNDEKLRKAQTTPSNHNYIATNQDWDAYIKDQIAYGGYDVFQEERLNAELSLVRKIPTEDLPLHVNDEWEFEECRALFESRLKNEEKS